MPRVFKKRLLAAGCWLLETANPARSNSQQPTANSHFTPVACLCLTLFMAPSLIAGETPQLISQVSASEIYFGESVDYQVTVKNAKNPAAPDMAAFQNDFDVTYLGDTGSSQISITFNGQQMERSFDRSYSWKLTPKHAGTLNLPAPTATIEGQKIVGRQTGTLRVIAPEKQDTVMMEIVCSRSKVYPTQPFEITLRIFVKPLPDVPNRDPLYPLNPPALQINWVNPIDGLSSEDLNKWLQKFVTDKEHGFSINGFSNRNDVFAMFGRQRSIVFDLNAGREAHATLNGAKADYVLYELKRTFTAAKAGSYTLGPATLKGAFVEGRVPGGQYTGHNLFVVAPAHTVEVREVPSPRPRTFCGGIGNYKTTVIATPTTLRVGDPLTLTLTVEREAGSGALELLAAPDLSANPKLAEDFEIIDKAPVGEAKGDTKRFVYGLRPKRPGGNIPPLTLTTFNPDTETFVDTQTQGVQLTVTQGAQFNAVDLVGALPGNQRSEIKSRQSGIFQNLIDVAELGDQRINVSVCLAISLGAWLGYGLLGLFVSRWRLRAGDAALKRRQRARRQADQSIRDAQSAFEKGDNQDGVKFIRAGVVGLIADMLHLTAAGMTAHEADAALSASGVSGETRSQTVKLLESIESLEYGSPAALDRAALVRDAQKLIPLLHRELEAKR